MNTLVIILALLTFFSTLIGGVVIVKFRKYLPFFFAFASGSLVAVSFLDLLPESLDISRSINLPVRYIMIAVVFSFFFYSLLERFFLTHHLEDTDDHEHIMGPIGAGSLVVHSFLDGAAIGSAFHVNASIGLIVALAVIFHDFTDGINTVTVMLKNKQQIRKTVIFLILDAVAPVAGVLATTAIAIPENILAIMLAVFVGEFLYIGASTLLPETRKNLSKGIIVAMAIGIALITVLTSLI
ncbi:Zinc transporter ZupT [uncultured archaeon]|nr:Zinc transporter ZupT [uncultured archaeon]